MNSLSNQKQILRTQTRVNLSASEKRFADIQITKSLMSLRVYKNAKSICTYVSMPSEVNTHQIIREALLAKGSIIIPKVQGITLELYSIRSFEELSIGPYGFLEPHIRRAHVPIQTIDLFIIPGLAFGRDGSRLGTGKGYYDRLLQDVHVPVIGLSYDRQLFDTIPHSAKDKKIDIIITETHIYDFNITPLRSKNL
ncbi:MAG: 5-formyltetrahydrofolate cyclo-ligase [Candidatus Gottesmanbacteria bacterium]